MTAKKTNRGGYHGGGRNTVGAGQRMGETKPIAIRVPNEVRKSIEAFASARGMKPAQVYRDAIVAGLPLLMQERP